MDILKLVFIILFVIYGIFMLIFALLEKRPFYTLFMFMAFGVLVLLTLNLISPFTKIALPINPYTVAGSAVCGVPGVITLLLLKLIFI